MTFIVADSMRAGHVTIASHVDLDLGQIQIECPVMESSLPQDHRQSVHLLEQFEDAWCNFKA